MTNENYDNTHYQKWIKSYFKITAVDLVKTYILKKNIKNRTYIARHVRNSPSFTRLERILVLHALKKWMGLRTKVLESHQIAIYKTKLLFQDNHNHVTKTFVIDSSSCSLCQFYLSNEIGSETQDSNEIDCEFCPLSKTLGGKTCDDSNMPYDIFWDFSDPRPMIKALWETARNLRLAEQAERKSKK